MSHLPSPYLDLLREASRNETDRIKRPVKRRRRDESGSPVEPKKEELDTSRVLASSSIEVHDVIDVISSDDNGNSDVQEIESPMKSSNEIIEIEPDNSESDDEDDFDSDEFEDVDVNEPTPQSGSYTAQLEVNKTPNDEELHITFTKPEPIKKPKKKKIIIDKEERVFRKNVHLLYVSSMIAHGVIRNRWCNDYGLQAQLKSIISPEVFKELHPRSDIPNVIRSRRFLDGLRHVMVQWSRSFKVITSGLTNKGWNELRINQSKVDYNMSLEKFSYLIMKQRGSKDLGAQGFVSLLRALKVEARLIFSLQPPDFTSQVPSSSKSNEPDHEAKKPQSSGTSSKRKFLYSVRKQVESAIQITLEGSDYPVFWIEAWNSYDSKWVTIDPVCFSIVETVRSKSKLEPPPSDRLCMAYVIAFDKLGGVKDVTRRYSQHYNAKTRKRRLTKEDDMFEWYERYIKSACSPARRVSNKIDLLEAQDFEKQHLFEGMPNSMEDFKHHPIYALESHLHQNEVIFPKESCGVVRKKGKSKDVVRVYKRANVHKVRSAKAWYMRGRMLKVGEKPMLIRTAKPGTQEDDDIEDTDVRLYGEFQTDLYVPPPIVDGKVTKNAYGNIDVYVPSMLPKGGCLISSPLAVTAARIIGIDFAPAVVGFDFEKRSVTARNGGIVIATEYKDAVELAIEHLEQEEVEKERHRIEMVALKHWKFLLTKLRIANRLNAQHGTIKDLEGTTSSGDEKSDDYSVQSDSDGSDVADFAPGGFMLESGGFDEGEAPPTDNVIKLQNQIQESENYESVNISTQQGGFFHEEEEDVNDGSPSAGGFFHEEDANTGSPSTGGFFHEEDVYEGSPLAGGFFPEEEEDSALDKVPKMDQDLDSNQEDESKYFLNNEELEFFEDHVHSSSQPNQIITGQDHELENKYMYEISPTAEDINGEKDEDEEGFEFEYSDSE